MSKTAPIKKRRNGAPNVYRLAKNAALWEGRHSQLERIGHRPSHPKKRGLPRQVKRPTKTGKMHVNKKKEVYRPLEKILQSSQHCRHRKMHPKDENKNRNKRIWNFVHYMSRKGMANSFSAWSSDFVNVLGRTISDRARIVNRFKSLSQTTSVACDCWSDIG